METHYLVKGIYMFIEIITTLYNNRPKYDFNFRQEETDQSFKELPPSQWLLSVTRTKIIHLVTCTRLSCQAVPRRKMSVETATASVALAT